MRAKGWLVVLVVSAVCLARTVLVAAQVNRATISGTVTDLSGAAIPGVTVALTGETGIVQTASTNEAGQYTTPASPSARTQSNSKSPASKRTFGKR
jgi:hypothetical protein